MKIFKTLQALILIFCISSCTVPLTVSLFNNSPTKIEVIFDDQIIILEQGASAEIIGLEDRAIKIKSGSKTYRYDVASTYYANFEFVGWGPFTKRVFFAQFEGNGKVWATNQWQPRPARNFQDQPEGFPLVPSS